MKVWLYYRLSRDEDEELNSLNNQRKIIYNFAVSNGHEVVGESFDDNVSGMHFNREGIEKIYEVVEAGKIEAIIVKDLSRLGRHRTQTALFIDYLREHDVRVLSATENIDTFNENDDLIIGFKGLVNDFYARDGSRRVRTGYRQKQREGIVTIPPFGYFKDKNTKKVVVVEEAAETVRLIFSAYVGGSGMKAIARTLNEQRRKTPALMQMELLNKRLPNTQDGILKKYLWDATMVARILRDESYIGTLICHKSERNKINKTFRFTDPEEQFRHENYLPMIVTCEIWEQAQALLTERKEKNVRAGTNRGILRYGGLLRCKDCGRTFTARKYIFRCTDLEIVSTYNSELRGICNYYSIASNFNKLQYFEYLMEYSCLKTLAGKHESTSRKMMRKYRDGNGSWGVPYQTKAGIKRRSFARFMDCKNTDLWTDKIIDFAIAHIGSRTSFDDRLSARVCELCGKTNVPLEIHHVNKVKNLKGKQLWELAMIAKKRKTLAVCKDCHHKIHHP